MGYMHGDAEAIKKSYILDMDNSGSRVGAKINGYVSDLGLTVGSHI